MREIWFITAQMVCPNGACLNAVSSHRVAALEDAKAEVRAAALRVGWRPRSAKERVLVCPACAAWLEERRRTRRQARRPLADVLRRMK